MVRNRIPLARLFKNFLLKHKHFILFLEVLAILGGIVFFISAGAVFGLIITLDRDLPSLSALEEYKDVKKWSYPTNVYDINGELICRFSQEKRNIVTYNHIPGKLVDSFIAVEDKRFRSHSGIDFYGIFRAVYKDIIATIKTSFKKRRFVVRKVQGASTITQQLARNLFLTPKKSLKRKFKEMLLAYKIERRYHKNEILERYLNKIYLGTGRGRGVYGIEAAARAYFNKHVEDLNIAEIAILSGLPKRPNAYSPIRHPARAKRRQMLVLKLMSDQNLVDPSRIDSIAEEFWKNYRQPGDTKTISTPVEIRRNLYPYLSEYLRPILEDILGEEVLYRGGYKIYTTFDLTHQQLARSALSKGLTRFNLHAMQNWEIFHGGDSPPINPTPAEGALISLDPTKGEIKAMVGGSGFNTYNQLNRTIQARRQPGSGFKPFIYLAAIDSGKFTAASLVNDAPVIFETPSGDWIPQNFEKRFFGPRTLRFMLAHSVNVASVKLMTQLADDSVSDNLKERIAGELVIHYARKAGITSPLKPFWSLVLGTFPVTPIEIATAYGVFANQGVLIKPYAIRYIENRDGDIIYNHIPVEEPVIKKDSAYILTNLLRGVVKNGTGRSIGRVVKRPIAGKTGTTDNFRDAWFIGFSPDLSCAVWVGYDSGGISLGPKQSGGRVAGPIWAEYVKGVTENKPVREFTIPENIVLKKIDSRTGLLAQPECRDVILESFIRGTEPTEICYYNHDEIYFKTSEIAADTVAGLLNNLEDNSFPKLKTGGESEQIYPPSSIYFDPYNEEIEHGE